MIKAVIFDMDGLLLDSTSVWQIVDAAFLRKRGITYTETIRDRLHGIGHREAIAVYKEAGVRGDMEDLLVELRTMFFEAFLKAPRLLPNADTLLKTVSPKYHLALATGNAPRENILNLLQMFKVAHYFSIIVTGDEVKKGKPHPEIYLTTAAKLGVQPLNCLVLEDAPNGVMAGKAAGMAVYGVNPDKGMRKKLAQAGADKVFTNLENLRTKGDALRG